MTKYSLMVVLSLAACLDAVPSNGPTVTAPAISTQRRVTCTSNTVLTIQPLGAVQLQIADTWTVYTHPLPSTINSLTISGNLFTSTRYWVYAYSNAGTLDFTTSPTPPDIALRYKSGDTSQLYVSTFVVDAGGLVVPYTQADGEYTYDQPVGGTDATQLLINGDQTVLTSVPLNYSIPPTASTVSFIVSLNVTAAGRSGDVRSQAGGNAVVKVIDDGVNFDVRPGKIPLNSGFAFKYSVSNAASRMNVFAAGFSL